MQKLRFIAVGLWNTAFGYFVFYVSYLWLEGQFNESYKGYMLAIIMSQILSVIQAFFLHKHVTFRSKISGVEMLYEFLRFIYTYVFTFSTTIIAMPLVTELLHIKPELSAFIVMLIVAIISYILNMKYVFKR